MFSSGVRLRLGNVYGPRQNPMGEAGVIAIFGGRLRDGRAADRLRRRQPDPRLRLCGRRGRRHALAAADPTSRARSTSAPESRPTCWNWRHRLRSSWAESRTSSPSSRRRAPGEVTAERQSTRPAQSANLGWRARGRAGRGPPPHAGLPLTPPPSDAGAGDPSISDSLGPRGAEDARSPNLLSYARPSLCRKRMRLPVRKPLCDQSCVKDMLDTPFYIACLKLTGRSAWWSAAATSDWRRSTACWPATPTCPDRAGSPRAVQDYAAEDRSTG